VITAIPITAFLLFDPPPIPIRTRLTDQSSGNDGIDARKLRLAACSLAKIASAISRARNAKRRIRQLRKLRAFRLWHLFPGARGRPPTQPLPTIDYGDGLKIIL